jgi:amino acid transporter
MTVLAGGIVATFAVTGVVGVPVAFPIIALALGLFTVGYAAMSRHIYNAGAFYSYLAQGLGKVWAVSGAGVALLSYNTIQIGLYGLFGVAASGFATAQWNITWDWWVWAVIAWAVVGLCGILRIDFNAAVLSVLLIGEVIAVLAFDAAAFIEPAGGSISTNGLWPGELFGPGLGGVLAFTIAAFIGFESGGAYAQDVKDPRRTVARSTYITLAIIGVLYTVSAWALTVAIGPDKVVDAARDPNSGVPFATLATVLQRHRRHHRQRAAHHQRVRGAAVVPQHHRPGTATRWAWRACCRASSAGPAAPRALRSRARCPVAARDRRDRGLQAARP